MRLREQGWQKIADGLRANDVELITKGVEDGREADDVVKRLNENN